MNKIKEMFDMEIPEWLEGSEEARGSKKAVLAVLMFFILFFAGNVVPTVLQTVSLVSFVIKEMDFSVPNPLSSVNIDGQSIGEGKESDILGSEESGGEIFGNDFSGSDFSGLGSTNMAKLEAFLEWLESDAEYIEEPDNWEEDPEGEILEQINQGNLSVSNGKTGELSLLEQGSISDFIKQYMNSTYQKTMALMSKLPPAFYLVALYSTVFATLTFLLWGHFVEKRSFRSLGFFSENFFSKYLKGLGIGFLLFGTVVLLNYGSGSIQFSGINKSFSFGSCLLFFGGFILQGMNEEVMFRGYLMSRLSVREKFWTAVLVNSVLFGLFHILNAGVTLLALFNIILFGVFASLYAMADDGIAGVCAIHTIWNFLQGNIFGFEVSGNNMGEPLFVLGEERANLINGGTFGAEGGLAVTVVLFIAVIIVFEKNSRNSRWMMV